MLFLFSPVWALLLDFHLTLLFLLPTISPRKQHLVQLITIATLFLLLHLQTHGLSVDIGITQNRCIHSLYAADVVCIKLMFR